MNAFETVVIGTCVVLALVNALVSYRVITTDLYEPSQKFFQCALIWLFPVFGVGLAHAMMHEPKLKVRGYAPDDLHAGPSVGYTDTLSDGHFGGGDHSS